MSELNVRLMEDMKEAMRNKDGLRKGVLTLIRAGLIRAAKEKKEPLTDAEQTAVIQRELKQTRQTLQEAVKANREDVAAEAREKIAIIEAYIPPMMNELDIIHFLLGKGAKKGDNTGVLMGKLMKENKGKVDADFAKGVIEKYFG